MRSHLVTLAPASDASSERASQLLSELDEWFELSASPAGKPHEGFALVEVGGHILDLEGATAEVSARLDQIDLKWRQSLKVVDSTSSPGGS